MISGSPVAAALSLARLGFLSVVFFFGATVQNAQAACPPGCPYPFPFCCCPAPCPIADATIFNLYTEPSEYEEGQDRMGIEPGQKLISEIIGGNDTMSLEEFREAQGAGQVGEASWVILQRMILETLRSEGRDQDSEEGDDRTAEGEAPPNCPAIAAPLRGNPTVSSGHGPRRHPVFGAYAVHHGTDWSVPIGTPIYASADGVVGTATFAGGAGNLLEISHGSRSSGSTGCMTRYMHLDRFAPGVQPGTTVQKGQLIGYTGNTGQSTGPHLHFEVRNYEVGANGRPARGADGRIVFTGSHDPVQYISGRTTNIANTGAQATNVVRQSQPLSAGSQITRVVEARPGVTTVQYSNGTIEERAGTRAFRNNNPGNIIDSDFARRNGAIGTDGRFAVFPSVDAGRAAMERLLFETSSYRDLSIGQAITRYAPPTENNTASYIRQVTNALGTSPNTLMASLSPQQRQIMTSAIETIEGFRAGNARRLGSPSLIPDLTGSIGTLPSFATQLIQGVGSAGTTPNIGGAVNMISQIANAFNRSTFSPQNRASTSEEIRVRDQRSQDLNRIALYAQAGGVSYLSEIEEYLNRTRILESMVGSTENWPEDLVVRSIVQSEVIKELSRLAALMSTERELATMRARSRDPIVIETTSQTSPSQFTLSDPVDQTPPQPTPEEIANADLRARWDEAYRAYTDSLKAYDDARFKEEAQITLANTYAEVLEHERLKWDMFEIEKGIIAGLREIAPEIMAMSGRSPEEEWIALRAELVRRDPTGYFDVYTKWSSAEAAARTLATAYDRFNLRQLETRNLVSESPPPPVPSFWQTMDGPVRNSLRVNDRNQDLLTRYQIRMWREECMTDINGNVYCQYRWEDPFYLSFQFYLEARKRKDNMDRNRRGEMVGEFAGRSHPRHILIAEFSRDPRPFNCLTAVHDLNVDKATGRGVIDVALSDLYYHYVDIHPWCGPREWRNVLPTHPADRVSFELGSPISHMFLRGMDAAIWAARQSIAEHDEKYPGESAARIAASRLQDFENLSIAPINGHPNLRNALATAGMNKHVQTLDEMDAQARVMKRSRVMSSIYGRSATTLDTNPSLELSRVSLLLSESSRECTTLPEQMTYRVTSINGRALAEDGVAFSMSTRPIADGVLVGMSGNDGCNSFGNEAFLLACDTLRPQDAARLSTRRFCDEKTPEGAVERDFWTAFSSSPRIANDNGLLTVRGGGVEIRAAPIVSR